MEIALRTALIAWLKADATLSAQLNAVVEEAPTRSALPWLAIAASASTDWSVKERRGREVRLAFELHCRAEKPDGAAALIAAIEARITAIPGAQSGFQIVTCQFLRARAEQRSSNTRAVLLEYRFRLLSD